MAELATFSLLPWFVHGSIVLSWVGLVIWAMGKPMPLLPKSEGCQPLGCGLLALYHTKCTGGWGKVVLFQPRQA